MNKWSKITFIIALLAIAGVIGIVSGCSMNRRGKQEKQSAASAVAETEKVNNTKDKTSTVETKDTSKEKANTAFYGSEDYKKIPNSLKEKKAYKYIDDETLEYNRQLVEEARENIVIVPAK